MFKKFLMILLLVSLSTSCNRKSDVDYSVIGHKNNIEIANAGLTNDIPKDDALIAIKTSSAIVAKKLDPEDELKPTTTAPQIAYAEKIKEPGKPNPELIKVVDYASKGPESSFGSLGWGTIGGIALASVGILGKFLGPPFNIVGSLAQTIGSRMVPDYDKNKKVAAGVIVSIDKTLDDLELLLSSLSPEFQEELRSKLKGRDLVDWVKRRLAATHQDLGVHDDVDSLISKLKKEVTTNDGVIKPGTEEFEKFLKKIT